jgi:uncharacterized RDD family membrane protein YckC
MKCPKCQYIGFDGHTRCRHCGYDLSLAATTEVTPDETDMPLDAAPDVPDVVYRPESSARAQARAAIQKRAASRTPQPESFDLPLFATPGIDDRPALPASRPPLSVRRSADSPRARAAAAAAFAPSAAPEPAAPAASEATGLAAEGTAAMADVDTEPRLDARLEFDAVSLAPPESDPDSDLSMTFGGTPLAGDVRAGGGALILPGREASGSVSAGFARARLDAPADIDPPVPAAANLQYDVAPDQADAVTEAPAVEPRGSAAPLGPRVLAGLVDIAVLAAVDAAVILATLRATGVEWSQASRLPLAPLGVFLVLLAIGYLSLCTVLAGRTFGKAAFGLAVVETGGRPVRLGPAVVRALIQVLTVPAAGIGFLPALLGADRRSLYDRLAGTDVVRDRRAAEDSRPE